MSGQPSCRDTMPSQPLQSSGAGAAMPVEQGHGTPDQCRPAPLVQHKLTLMRERDRSTKGFRELLNEIGMLLAYEGTRDLPVELVEIETPLCQMKAPKIAGKKLTLAPVLRAGVGFLGGMLALLPSARVAHIGLYR